MLVLQLKAEPLLPSTSARALRPVHFTSLYFTSLHFTLQVRYALFIECMPSEELPPAHVLISITGSAQDFSLSPKLDRAFSQGACTSTSCSDLRASAMALRRAGSFNRPPDSAPPRASDTALT